MPGVPDRSDIGYDILLRLRTARRDFHLNLSRSIDARERLFAPPQMLRSLREHVAQSADGLHNERCTKLFVLTVLLYGALDWQFAGFGIDIETDVQLERMRQDHYHGGPAADDLLSAEGWRERLHHQVVRLEQQLACPEAYAERLVKLTALAQAALEAACRTSRGTVSEMSGDGKR